MKFTILFIVVMLLKGIDLHRHMHRHGDNEQMTDLQKEINQLNDKAVDKPQTVHVTDIKSKPGDKIENVFKIDGTKMAQDNP